MRPEVLISGLAVAGIALAAPGVLNTKEAVAEPVQILERTPVADTPAQADEVSKRDSVSTPRKFRKRNDDAIPCKIL